MGDDDNDNWIFETNENIKLNWPEVYIQFKYSNKKKHIDNNNNLKYNITNEH